MSDSLRDVRILSLALNLPGPAALMRCRRLGADCIKFEPPTGDPMRKYSSAAYAELHDGIDVRRVDLKTERGQELLRMQLLQSDVLLTSFRPSALKKLGLDASALGAYPRLSHVAIVGAAGSAAEIPGHDLTYLAEHGLVSGDGLPATLYADMSGSLLATQAILETTLRRYRCQEAGYFEVTLSGAAEYIALPRVWGLTLPSGAVGGGSPFYGVYPCKDGWVAVAALERHFATVLCALAGAELHDPADAVPDTTRTTIARFLAAHTRAELDALATQKDLPLRALGDR